MTAVQKNKFMRSFQLLILLVSFFASQACPADDKDDREIGRAILAIQKAIANPEAPGSLDAVTELGHKTAHYTMVRGWLVQELRGAESIKSAQKPDAINPAIDARIAFLKKAIRAIDLE